MKTRDSGMPAEDYWESLFDVPLILDALGIDRSIGDLAELGCGYGTFTIPAAKRISGVVYALDIDPEMIAHEAARGGRGVNERDLPERDVTECGFGLAEGCVDAALLFNILHCESPEALLRHAACAVRDGGEVLVIHWRHDPSTPRGPSMAIRPTPGQIVEWSHATGMLHVVGPPIDLPPWHYGLSFRRVASAK